ncbi:protein kinase [Bradyrhizobium pachyrhizi]|uniref:Protein kinase n=1 Tax=Bradyrhizobium pachyrhizi TaxID=280333 RepID=A0A844T3C4_9BRAD|nr:serine/threonine-protein kinase [Bradyrhizobium pachyrhizi]MVT70022.1 protein kinase [Bradyrhizobium pachyrhizi]
MISPGTRVGDRYRVLSYIDSGGMQDVYKAYDELTEETVALKTPQAGQAKKRFHSSAQLSGRVNHHNVAKTYDFFESQGSFYLIEELVEGTTLEKATLSIMPQIDPHMAAYLLIRIAKGLAASHNAGVAHRDLKPSNVLVDDTLTEVKITDFGIATLADSLFEEVVRIGDLTKSTSGTIRGALPYMAPEMMFRKPGDYVGKEADIWSLSAMTFRLMTGEYPFGEGMMVPVNVQNNTRTRWPSFMTTNSQFAPLAQSLMEIVDECLVYDKSKRPTAEVLVQRCESLCFNYVPRTTGTIQRRIGATRGFIVAEDGQSIFFHDDSIYGKLSAQLGAKVSFSQYPGAPAPRAHPVMVLGS